MTDRDILRPLAARVREIAGLDVQKTRAASYRALNRGERVRPIVLIHELPWNQLDCDETRAICENPVLRAVETNLRRTLFQWRYFQGDMIVSPQYDLPRRISITDICPPVVEDTYELDPANNIISHLYKNQLPDEASLARLTVPEVSEDVEGGRADFDLVSGAIGDLLPVRHAGLVYAGFFSPWDRLSRACGVEAILTDLAERPEFLHEMVNIYTDCSLKLLQKCEDMNLLDPEPTVYMHCTAGLTDDLPGEIKNGKMTRANIWGRGTAQIFAAVSPRMHGEFEIPYAKRFFEGFNRVYYGCCEPLDKKIDLVRQIPNVTKISITPWANVSDAADRMGGDFVMAWKPNPAAVAVPSLNEDALRKEIAPAIEACRRNHTPMEMTLKDISSVSYNLENLVRWTKIAMEMAENA